MDQKALMVWKQNKAQQNHRLIQNKHIEGLIFVFG